MALELVELAVNLREHRVACDEPEPAMRGVHHVVASKRGRDSRRTGHWILLRCRVFDLKL